MKIFLSWSGDFSHKVACVFREWLPSVIQSIHPYVSSKDIDKGSRWSTDIAKELESSSFGIIFVTPDNLESPWIHFEAGALSKSIDKSRVSPFLFDLKRSEIQGPLLQFQSTVFEGDDVLKLLKSINNCFEEKDRLKDENLEKSFKIWWGELEKDLKGIKRPVKELETKKGKPDIQSSEILEEMLEILRQQQRIINDPSKLFPRDYLEYALRKFGGRSGEVPRSLRLHDSIKNLQRYLQSDENEIKKDFPVVRDMVERIHDEFHRPENRMRNIERRPNRVEDDSDNGDLTLST